MLQLPLSVACECLAQHVERAKYRNKHLSTAGLPAVWMQVASTQSDLTFSQGQMELYKPETAPSLAT